ncbi:hypothetical protein LTR36_007547 [Oleoguttula mirabilis]|uniref:Uncharacterized protein n=1 Tax=Oleoguttula mirabilis TaxID=1507867 RepID=A0AAV9JTQ4_9PEZI|nr:hypothetical protein LTR36_007547 [Oleoguttula mirabilis]
MVSPSPTTLARPEPETPTTAVHNHTNPPLAEGTQESLSGEDARLQAQADVEDTKRDEQDPDFVASQPSLKRARVDSASATPVTPISARRRGRGVKKYTDCTSGTQAERHALVKGIRDKWRVPHTEWMPEGLMPHGEPRDWGRPLLSALRRLADVAPGRGMSGVANARRAMGTAFAERSESGDGTLWLTAEDVKAAINALSAVPPEIARSPTLAPSSFAEPAALDALLERLSDDAASSGDYHDTTTETDPLLPPTTPGQATGSRRAEKQAVKSEPGAERPSVGASTAALPTDDLEETFARIDEIHKLKADEAKAKAKWLVLEDRQRRWESLQTRGSSRVDAISGDTLGD